MDNPSNGRRQPNSVDDGGEYEKLLRHKPAVAQRSVCLITTSDHIGHTASDQIGL